LETGSNAPSRRPSGLSPRLLELEVTETVFLEQIASNLESALRALSAEGVTIALDDFGAGYASLTHLQQFPVLQAGSPRPLLARASAPWAERRRDPLWER